MKKLILSATVAFTVLATSNIQAQQGFGTNTPDRSSAVDIVSSKRGLLIPRIDIPNLDQAAPVKNPANALMVYNTGSATAAGFYYWDASYNNGAGRWVRFVSSNSGSAVTVSAGTNVAVDKTTNGHDTDYKVSVKGGTAPNQVLVTKLGDNNTYVSKWVNPEDFLKDVVTGTNGVKTEIIKDDKGNVVNTVVKLGGDLTEKTVLNTGKDKELAITGLETLVGKDAATGNKFNSTNEKVVVMGADGILKNVSAKDLVEDAIDKGSINGKALTSKSIIVDGNAATSLLKDVNIEVKGGEKEGQILVSTPKLDDKGQPVVENGKTVYETKWVDADKVGVEVTNGIQKITAADGTTKLGLGGSLNQATTITTDATNTLAIDGLTELKGEVSGNNVVMADANGVLKETSAENLIGNAIETGNIKAKNLTSESIVVTGGESSVLKDTQLEIKGGSSEGQVLVTTPKVDDQGNPVTDTAGNPVYVTKWVDAAGNTVKSGQGVTVGADNTVNLGGKITNIGTTPGAVIDLTDDKGTKAGDIAIKGLEDLVGKDATTGTKLDTNTDNLVIADANGVLKQTSAKNLIEDAVGKGDLEAKTLKGDGITVTATETTAGTTLEVASSLLKDVTLGIADNAITSAKIKDGEVKTSDLDTGAVTQDKLYAGTKGADGVGIPAAEGTVPVANTDGTVTYKQVTGKLLNGKALKSSSIKVTDGANALLDETTIEIAGGTSAGQVLVTKKEGDTFVTEWVDASALGNTVKSGQGVTVGTDNTVNLGGTITEDVIIAVKEGTNDVKGGSLAITGLGTAVKDKANKTVVVQADGTLATIDKTVGDVTINDVGTVTIGENVVKNYHPSMAEVVIEVMLGATDTNLNLPAVDGTEGQTISVKIVNEDDTHSGYLIINDDKGTYLSEGSMPYQGWVIKSNGTKWIVVGRN
ncbi:hypothetical protein VSO92_08615 [Myroides pelagicus]|uniref:hypothetical protein n=1 Tax=Myroides pelagicus TaxID=270914 RepID=UPI002DBD31F7|nr:hypothetical protein [Myroides pelagicus]MEC4114169.1 hypothetical protein [Myroides pelagicus]